MLRTFNTTQIHNPILFVSRADIDHVHSDWTTLSHLCFRASVDKYTYAVCPFKNITQKDAGTVHVVMGVWKEWVIHPHSGHLSMLYTDGNVCTGGKRRQTHVFVQCRHDGKTATETNNLDDLLKEETHVANVTEPRICEYEITMVIPYIAHTALYIPCPDCSLHSFEISIRLFPFLSVQC